MNLKKLSLKIQQKDFNKRLKTLICCFYMETMYRSDLLDVEIIKQFVVIKNKQTNTDFSLSSSVEPLSGNMEEMASKILSEGNFLLESLLPWSEEKHTLSKRLISPALFGFIKDSGGIVNLENVSYLNKIAEFILQIF